MSRAAKYKIGVFGSSAGDMDKSMPMAEAVGRLLGDLADSAIVITGACPGLPFAAARAAANKGAEVWGFSSSLDAAAQKAEYPADDLSIYARIIYVPADFPYPDSERACKKYRNVSSTAACDAGIVISGRWGTLNEFTNLLDMQKPVGVLTGTGGIADELPALARKISKSGQGRIIFNDDPEELVEQLIQAVRVR